MIRESKHFFSALKDRAYIYEHLSVNSGLTVCWAWRCAAIVTAIAPASTATAAASTATVEGGGELRDHRG